MGGDRERWGTHRLVIGDQHAQQVGHLHGVHGGHNDVAVVGVWHHGEWSRVVHPLYPGNLESHLVQDGSEIPSHFWLWPYSRRERCCPVGPWQEHEGEELLLPETGFPVICSLHGMGGSHHKLPGMEVF